MSSYVLSLQADNDLEEIWQYIALRNEQAADRQIDAFVQKFEVLARNPKIGFQRDDLKADLRSFAAGNYVILYLSCRQRN